MFVCTTLFVRALYRIYCLGGGDNLARLMRIAIEGYELAIVDFDKILDIFEENNHRVLL